MPSKSPAQARLMAAAAHDPEFAAKTGVPVKVAKEFNKADAGTGMIKPKSPMSGKEHLKLRRDVEKITRKLALS